MIRSPSLSSAAVVFTQYEVGRVWHKISTRLSIICPSYQIHLIPAPRPYPAWYSWQLRSLCWFSSVQLLSHVQLFVTPWTATRQSSLSITNSRSSLKLMSIVLVMPLSHLILCRPLLLLPCVKPSTNYSFDHTSEGRFSQLPNQSHCAE